MFRIDRRLVKISVPKVRHIPKGQKPETKAEETVEQLSEVGVEGVSPDAAASDTVAALTDESASPDDLVKMLMADAEKDVEDELQRMIEAAKEEAARLVESEKGKADGLIDDAYEEAEKMLADVDKKVEEAEQLKADAQKKLEEAEKVLEEARNEAIDIRKSAHDEGYTDGFAEGEKAGRAVYDEKLEQQQQIHETELKNVLDEIAQERERLAGELEQDTVTLALEVVRKIFAPAEKELGNVFTSLIKNALRQMSADNKIMLRVSPSEYDRLFGSGAGEIKLDSGVTVTVTVLKDLALEEGDLIIDAEDMTVNAGVNSQLRYIELAFSEANVVSS